MSVLRRSCGSLSQIVGPYTRRLQQPNRARETTMSRWSAERDAIWNKQGLRHVLVSCVCLSPVYALQSTGHSSGAIRTKLRTHAGIGTHRGEKPSRFSRSWNRRSRSCSDEHTNFWIPWILNRSRDLNQNLHKYWLRLRLLRWQGRRWSNFYRW